MDYALIFSFNLFRYLKSFLNFVLQTYQSNKHRLKFFDDMELTHYAKTNL
jgi:hypothetical protein